MTPLLLKDYAKIVPFFQNQTHQLCVYTPASISVWTSKIYQPCIRIYNDDTLLVGVRFASAKDDHLILPLGAQEFPPQELHRLAEENSFYRYWFVSDAYIDKYGCGQVETYFKLSEQPELHDYVYLTSDLAELAGNKYSKKRNLINQFKRAHPEDSLKVEVLNADNALECIDFIEEWCQSRDCQEDDWDDSLACEKIAAINTLNHIEKLDVTGILLRINNKICAYGVGARLTDNMGVFHFEKAFSYIKGLYQYFDQLCARRLFKGYSYINKESDMDISNLAKSKKSYHPAMMIKSWQMELK